MALSATLFKAELQVSDLDRHYYQQHELRLARHPSETDERMMVRLLVFALHAHDRLQFTRGLSSDEEPDLWRRDLSGELELWIELGQPDEKRIRRACGRAAQVFLYSYQSRPAGVWWEQNAVALQRLENLGVVHFPHDVSRELTAMTRRGMQLQCTLQEGQVWLSDGERSVLVEPVVWQAPIALRS